MTESADRAMPRFGVHEAKTQFPQLLRLVDGGQEVEILRNGEPVARLVPAAPRRTRQFGTDRGLVTIAEDFDAPLPDDVLATFLACGATCSTPTSGCGCNATTSSSHSMRRGY